MFPYQRPDRKLEDNQFIWNEEIHTFVKIATDSYQHYWRPIWERDPIKDRDGDPMYMSFRQMIQWKAERSAEPISEAEVRAVERGDINDKLPPGDPTE